MPKEQISQPDLTRDSPCFSEVVDIDDERTDGAPVKLMARYLLEGGEHSDICR